MLVRIIDFSLRNKFAVLVSAAALAIAGLFTLRELPVDAVPDLSDAQVIIYTEWPGQAPQIVEDQLTFPITTKMLSVPNAKVVRGYSFYGYSFVYVIFKDGTDPYWARGRALEQLTTLRAQLPPNVNPSLGPDATGVGWAFMYALNSTNRSLAELRSLQDWHLKYQLTSVPGVAEVASVGGFVRQYQVTVDPAKLRAYKLSILELKTAIERSNGETGGRSIEMGEKEFILRVRGYIESLDDLRKVAVSVATNNAPILLGQIANVQFGPEMRRGIAEWNGEGETVAGIVVVRHGANARQVIRDVKAKLGEAAKALPEDVKISVAYDRSGLIDRAVRTLRKKLIEESVVVILVCFAFLLSVRSALVALIILPLAVLVSFIVMFGQGITSNIMSLGGIAIAIGAMIDPVIIMIENAHKHLERDEGRASHAEIIRRAAIEVGPSLFYSLLVITVSFLPVFALQEQEGRLFKPLAYTKTYSMAAAALLSITLAPVLMGFFIRGKIPREEANPLNRFLTRLYHPLIGWSIRNYKPILLCAGIAVVWVFLPLDFLMASRLPEGSLKDMAKRIGVLFPFQNLGSEFMPPLYEGDFLYMPTTLPGIGPTRARALLQQTDQIIKSFPEVQNVLGKIGRAETATDSAPMEMLETTIQLKDEKNWPAVEIRDAAGSIIGHRRRTPEELAEAMNRAVQFPGLNNAWTMPIRARLDMLSTGIKTPVGIKLAGRDLHELERLGLQVEAIIRNVPGTRSVYSERLMGGNFIEFHIDREAIALHGLRIADVQDTLNIALGGMPLATTVEGLERYTINLRYDRDFRDSVEALRQILIVTPTGVQIPLGQLARLESVSGPMSIKTESAAPNLWVYIDTANSDLAGYVTMAEKQIENAMASGELKLPVGYSLSWSGQYEYILRARERLQIMVPLTILLIVLIIYLNTKSAIKTAIVLCAVPFSLIGAIWITYLLGYNLSVAVWVGIIALAGLDAETGVIMLLYLDLAYENWKSRSALKSTDDLREAIYEGAVKRLRPKAMTAAVIVAGLAPILWSHGAGSDVMKRIATPMIGGVVTSTAMELLIYPILFYLWRRRQLFGSANT